MNKSLPAQDVSFFPGKLALRQFLTVRWVLGVLAIGILALSVAGATTLTDWSAFGELPETPASAKPLPVEAIAARRTTAYQRPRVYTGVLRERRRSQIGFQRAGEIVELVVDEGDEVEAGQLIGRLDDRHIRARQVQLEAELAEARATLDELVAGPRKETIASKRAQLRELQAGRDVLEKQLQRRRELVRSASVSKEEYESFLFEFRAAAARAEAVQEQLEELLAGTRAERITAQRARLAQLEAALTDVRHDLDDTLLKAPFAGHVSQRLVDEGTVVASGTPVVEVVDDAQLEAWIGLPADVAAQLEIGGRHELAVGDATATATLRTAAPDLDLATRTRHAIFVLDQQGDSFVPGQVTRISLAERIPEPGYWVPSTALVRSTRGLWSVYVVVADGSGEVIELRDVELLDTLGAHSYVRGTLAENERIVATGTHRIVVGQRVTTSDRIAQVSLDN